MNTPLFVTLRRAAAPMGAAFATFHSESLERTFLSAPAREP